MEGSAISRKVSGDVVRYAAPELLENVNTSATMSSDVCSFGMLILECITKEIPFSNLSRDAAVIDARVGRRQCPPRPNRRVSDGLWDLMMRYWSHEPDHRPTMEGVHGFFRLHGGHI